MSLLPHLYDDPCFFRPSRIMDQHFGHVLDPDDFLQPLTFPRFFMRSPPGYFRNWKTSASQRDIGSTVALNKDRFQANLDVQQFKPEEISVKVSRDNVVTIEGKHEEKQDEHGQIYRHFVRKYFLPKNCDINRVESKLSSDGVLTISAPKVDGDQGEIRDIPITQTGELARPVERKSDGDK